MDELQGQITARKRARFTLERARNGFLSRFQVYWKQDLCPAWQSSGLT